MQRQQEQQLNLATTATKAVTETVLEEFLSLEDSVSAVPVSLEDHVPVVKL